jgi:hypothetical protein
MAAPNVQKVQSDRTFPKKLSFSCVWRGQIEAMSPKPGLHLWRKTGNSRPFYMFQRIHARLPALMVIALSFATSVAQAQTDEIQVYDAEIAAPGKLNLTLHSNYTPEGRDTPEFPGGIIPDKSWNGVPEWGYGVTEWFEAGLYLPLYSISRGRGLSFDGLKLRTLFVSPHAAERTFFYGINFEYSYNSKFWESSRFSGEIRPILGWHLHPVDIIINPILDTDYNGFKNLDFAPASRIAYNFSQKWAIALEEYADCGTLGRFRPSNRQYHELYGVVDYMTKLINVEFGAGFGLTGASDQVTLKLILSRDVN